MSTFESPDIECIPSQDLEEILAKTITKDGLLDLFTHSASFNKALELLCEVHEQDDGQKSFKISKDKVFAFLDRKVALL